jgi:DNA-binding transcriptional MerR regulator
MKDVATRLLTVSTAARRLVLSESSVRRLSNIGRLPSQRTESGVRLFASDDVDRMARELRNDNDGGVPVSI